MIQLKSVLHILKWAFFGVSFGVFFGAFSSVFQNGPDWRLGVEQSWWWFGLFGLIKGFTDVRLPAKDMTTAQTSEPK
jgi:hypothetical protein